VRRLGVLLLALAAAGEFTQVRLSDGLVGWVKTAYLTEREPSIVRVKRLEAELDRSRATSPALAEAAAASESLRRAGTISARLTVCAALIAGSCGFWLGYVTLAHRVKRKFGGIRIY
jgi:hypothetical protein